MDQVYKYNCILRSCTNDLKFDFLCVANNDIEAYNKFISACIKNKDKVNEIRLSNYLLDFTKAPDIVNESNSNFLLWLYVEIKSENIQCFNRKN